ncbi:hypothetical protein PSD17_34130 [Pseudonocardia sp. D17]|nr:hypothetical protein PSD17_34130 [Pseudonocardia sp. D17]
MPPRDGVAAWRHPRVGRRAARRVHPAVPMSPGRSRRHIAVATVVFDAGGPDDAVSARVRALLGAGADVECDLAALAAPDARALDGLLRLVLAARGHRGRLRFVGVPQRLTDLLVACGLDDVVDVEPRPPPAAARRWRPGCVSRRRRRPRRRARDRRA